MAGRNGDWSTSSLANNKAFHALEYHAARVRAIAGEVAGEDQHNRILEQAADVAHKNISLWNASTVVTSRFHASEVREMNAGTPYEEVEEFVDDDGPGEELLAQQAGVAAARDASDLIIASRQNNTRSNTAQRHPAMAAAKAASHITDFFNEDEDRSVGSSAAKQEIINLRGKSFLARTDLEGSSTVDMLAQLRGANWQSNSISVSKSSKSMTPVDRSGPSRSQMRRHDSVTAGGVTHDMPWSASKSFNGGKRPSALPDVSVHDDYSRPAARSGGPSSSGFGKGLMSRLKNILGS